MNVVQLKRPSMVILDVGHGASTLIAESGRTVLIDAGGGSSTLRDFLQHHGIKRLDVVLLSHADEDHICGLLRVLNKREVDVGAVYVNPAPGKATKIWEDLVKAFDKYRESGAPLARNDLKREISAEISSGEVRIEVLTPSDAEVLSARVAGQGRGTVADTNTMCAVIRVHANGEPVALLTGDLDALGFTALMAKKPDLRAQVLTVPHHGGLTGRGSTPQAAADLSRHLCRHAKPQAVVFSLGRTKYDNPLPEVVEAVRLESPDAWIGCTQLSERCCPTAAHGDQVHLADAHARGKVPDCCCMGSLVISLNGRSPSFHPSRDGHRRFVDLHIPKALCRTKSPAAALPSGVVAKIIRPIAAAVRRAKRRGR